MTRGRTKIVHNARYHDPVRELNQCWTAAPPDGRRDVDRLQKLSRDHKLVRDVRVWPDRVEIVEKNGRRHEAYFADGRVVETPPPSGDGGQLEFVKRR
jgi:hypothetical protein